MRLSISNIAWDPEEDEEVVGLLKCFGVDAIDIAPGKYFPEPIEATDEDIARVKNWWVSRGIEIVGMQALLFGTKGLNVFGGEQSREAMLKHIAAVCRIGAGLGGRYLVFGSPKNRDRSGLSDQEALGLAVPFFRKVGDIAQSHGVIICLEPNPTCYGANFMTTSEETAVVVEEVAHPAIKMQLDTGALAINGESPVDILNSYKPLIGHVHASEPDLVPLGDGGADHNNVFKALTQHLPNLVVSIEMLATSKESHLASIERALKFAVHTYAELESVS